MTELLRSTWSDAVSNDPKHRPQVMDWPSSICFAASHK